MIQAISGPPLSSVAQLCPTLGDPMDKSRQAQIQRSQVYTFRPQLLSGAAL